MTNRFDVQKIRDEEKRVTAEVRERMVTSIVAAFGVVVGLAWNDAVTTLINAYLPLGGAGIVAKFAYAIVLTAIISVLAYYISRLISKKETEQKTEQKADQKTDSKVDQSPAK